MKKLLSCLLIVCCLFGCSDKIISSTESSGKNTVEIDNALINLEVIVNEDISTFLDMKSSLRKEEDIELDELLADIEDRMDVFESYYNAISKENATQEQKDKLKELADNYYLYLNLLLDALEALPEKDQE